MDEATRLRRTVTWVAGLNFAFFWVEVSVALAIGSVALFADSVDFLEDTAVNLLIALALGWTLARRARVGRLMALIICLPAVAAAVQAIRKFGHPDRPDPIWLLATAGAAVAVNLVCALMLVRVRHHGGSLSRAAYLAARNDVWANLAIVAAGLVTLGWRSGWPDIVVGLAILVLNLGAAKEVWEVAGEERLAAKALAGEIEDD